MCQRVSVSACQHVNMSVCQCNSVPEMRVILSVAMSRVTRTYRTAKVLGAAAPEELVLGIGHFEDKTVRGRVHKYHGALFPG